MEGEYRLNTAKTVAVSNYEFWVEGMSLCPRGVKVQLLGLGGVTHYGIYDGSDFWIDDGSDFWIDDDRDFWIAWAPLPKRRPE